VSDFVNQAFRRPLMVLSDLLNNELGGQYVKKSDYTPTVLRALVYAVDLQGGRLSNPDWISSGQFAQTICVNNVTSTYNVSPTYADVPNPPDSVRARVIIDNSDIMFNDSDLRTYWPLFPGLQAPSPGELVYVLFEDRDKSHGLWLSKVPLDNDNTLPNGVQFSDMVKSNVGAGTQSNVGLFPDNPQNQDTTYSLLSQPGSDRALAFIFPDSSNLAG
jgi:hypothetical protein